MPSAREGPLLPLRRSASRWEASIPFSLAHRKEGGVGITLTNKLATVLIFLPLVSWADPAPFGMQIGEATTEDVRQLYAATRVMFNRYTEGEQYDLATRPRRICVFAWSRRPIAVVTTA